MKTNYMTIVRIASILTAASALTAAQDAVRPPAVIFRAHAHVTEQVWLGCETVQRIDVNGFGDSFEETASLELTQNPPSGSLYGTLDATIRAERQGLNAAYLNISQSSLHEHEHNGGFALFRSCVQNSASFSAYVLGPPGTPYRIEIDAFGTRPANASGMGHTTTGWSHPGWFFQWGGEHRHWVHNGNSVNDTVVHQGEIYSRVRITPSSVSSGGAIMSYSQPPFIRRQALEYDLHVEVTNRGYAQSDVSVSWIGIDDTDPTQPILGFNLNGQDCDVFWSMGDQVFQVGRFSSGSYSILAPSPRSLGEGLHDVKIWAESATGQQDRDQTILDTRFRAELRASSLIALYIPVSGVGARAGEVDASVCVYRNDWELPGASYDRWVNNVKAGMTVFAIRRRGQFGWLSLESEQFFRGVGPVGVAYEQCLAQENNYCVAGTHPFEEFGIAGQSTIRLAFGGESRRPFVGGAPWVTTPSSLELVIE